MRVFMFWEFWSFEVLTAHSPVLLTLFVANCYCTTLNHGHQIEFLTSDGDNDGVDEHFGTDSEFIECYCLGRLNHRFLLRIVSLAIVLESNRYSWTFRGTAGCAHTFMFAGPI